MTRRLLIMVHYGEYSMAQEDVTAKIAKVASQNIKDQICAKSQADGCQNTGMGLWDTKAKGHRLLPTMEWKDE